MNVHDIVFHPSESLRQRWDREFVELLLAGETENDIALKFGMSKKDIRVNRKRLKFSEFTDFEKRDKTASKRNDERFTMTEK